MLNSIREKISKIIIAVILVVCLVWTFYIIKVSFTDNDNHSYKDYPRRFESVLNEKFPLRDKWILLNSSIDYYLFNKSANREVTIGRDGWLFYTDDIPDYMQNLSYNDEQLAQICENVNKMKAYFDELGTEFVIYIAPNKSVIYADYMPEKIEKGQGRSRIDKAVDYLRENTDVTIIYPKEEIMGAIKEHPELTLYMKKDTHWNYMGAFFGTNPLLEALGKEPISFDSISYEEVNEPYFFWKGYDLAYMLGMQSIFDEDINYRISGYSDTEYQADKDIRNDGEAFQGTAVIKSNSPDRRKVLFMRDSYAEAMTPYLATSFGEITSVHRRAMMSRDEVSEYKPDICIYEMVERSNMLELDMDTWGQKAADAEE